MAAWFDPRLYWRWLLSRWGRQRIYVAIDGPDRLESDGVSAAIVAYAATRGARIVELMCSSDHREAAVQLLGRICQDAIEQDYCRVRLDAPCSDPLHQLMLRAGGEYRCLEVDRGAVFMANLLQPHRFLDMISGPLIRRATDAGLSLPCRLGLLVNKQKYQLSVKPDAVHLAAGPLGRSYLNCDPAMVSQLLLGHCDVRDAVEWGRAWASTRLALEMSRALFPQLSLWRPPWDTLSAD